MSIHLLEKLLRSAARELRLLAVLHLDAREVEVGGVALAQLDDGRVAVPENAVDTSVGWSVLTVVTLIMAACFLLTEKIKTE